MFEVRVLRSVEEIDTGSWDHLNGSSPFSSYHWYRFGEAALAGDLPFYVLLFHQGKPVARAAFWLTRQEPLPISWALARRGMQAVFRRWPLLICRTALANAPGLILPADDTRQAALETITSVAHNFAREHSASAVLFDNLSPDVVRSLNWSGSYTITSLAEPGTQMLLDGIDFETFLSRMAKSTRRNYHQHAKRAAELGIAVTCHSSASRIDEAIPLIRAVEHHHHTAPRPYVESIVQQIGMVGGTWFTAEIDEKLVGCCLLVGDGPVQLLTLLGLDYSVEWTWTYYQLMYAGIRRAIEIGVRDLRGGSGAYEFKRRLGFEIENNNFIASKVNNRALGWIAHRFAGTNELE